MLRLKSKIFCSFSLIFNFLRLQSSILYLYYPPTPVPKFLPHSQKHDLMIVNITHNAYMSVDMHIHVCTYQLSPFSFVHVCLMPWNWKSLCVGGRWIIPEENRFLSVFFFFEISIKGNSLKKINHLYFIYQNHNDTKAVKETNVLK